MNVLECLELVLLRIKGPLKVSNLQDWWQIVATCSSALCSQKTLK